MPNPAIDQAILDRLNALRGTNFNLVSEIDQLLAEIKTLPGFRAWAEGEAAHAYLQHIMKQAMSNGRRSASRASKRRAVRAQLHLIEDATQKGRTEGKTAAQIKYELSTTFLDEEWCVDEQASDWKPFRLMTAADCEAVAASRDKKGKTMLMDASFLRAVAKRLKGDETVEDRWSEKQLAQVFQKAQDAKYGLAF